jgi:excisionase family DNA binding protein
MNRNNTASNAKTNAQKPNAKKRKGSLRRISSQKPPTEEEVKKAMDTRKALAGDIAMMNSLKLEDEEIDQFQPIVFSDTWYEFSVFCHRLNIPRRSVNRWLENGWIAYSKLGRFRLINKFDFEETMLYFYQQNNK